MRPTFRLGLAALVVALCFATSARATATINTNLKDVGISNVTAQGTFVRFELKNYGSSIPRVIGTGAIAWGFKDFKPDANGLVSGTIYDNDQILPAGTFYHVCVWYTSLLYRCGDYIIHAGSTFDLSTAVPISSATPTPVSTVGFRVFVFLQVTSSSTWTIVHNFNDTNVLVQVFDANSKQIFPDTLTETDGNTVTITFVSPQAGRAIVVSVSSVALVTGLQNAALLNPTANQVVAGGFDWTVGGNLAFSSGGAFLGTLKHANTGNRTYTFPDAAGVVAEVLTATSASFSPGLLGAGVCSTQAPTTVTGATTAMDAKVTPATDPGTGLSWMGVLGAGTVAVRVCNTSTGNITPTATSYNIRVLQ